jgi:zinc transport system substrate-binding protein
MVLAVLLAGCGSGRSAKRTARTTVVAAFYPLAFAAQEVGGASVEVRDLTPAGSEPHDLELTPSRVTTIHEADLVLLMGHGFQPQVEDAAGTGKRVAFLLDTPGLARRDDDPHVWLDPLRYEKLVRRIGALLHRPGRARRLIARLGELDREFRRGLARCARRDIVTSHEAFGYLAQRYHLRQIAITGLSPEAEPTPGKLRDVLALVRETGATTVFFETLVSPKLAETVARETGARTAVLDPIEGLTGDEAARGADYFSLMRANLRALRLALGCR